MSQPTNKLADEIIRLVEINRTTINGLDCGEIIFKAHRGRLVEVITSETLRLSSGSVLHPVTLNMSEKK